MTHDNNIDTLRFVGAFLVLFGHTFELSLGKGGGFDPISDVIRHYTAYHERLPGIGVAMFFVLSGYLVTRSFERRPNLLAYMEGRILRIYPALWIVLALTAFVLGPLVTALDTQEYFSQKWSWKYFTHNMTLYPNIAHKLPGVFTENPRTGVNGSLWTLPIEVRMYVIVALIGVFGVLRSRLAFNLLALLILVWFLFLPDHFFLLYRSQHERLGLYFLLGALFYLNRNMIRLHWLGIVLLALAAVLAHGTPLFNVTYAVWFTYGVLYLSFHRSLRLPDLSKHGDFSYGLYLYAFPVTQVMILLIGPGRPWLAVSLVLPVTLLFAMASWFVIEKPSLRLKGVLSGRLSGANGDGK